MDHIKNKEGGGVNANSEKKKTPQTNENPN
jgi:hypothetical protein